MKFKTAKELNGRFRINYVKMACAWKISFLNSKTLMRSHFLPDFSDLSRNLVGITVLTAVLYTQTGSSKRTHTCGIKGQNPGDPLVKLPGLPGTHFWKPTIQRQKFVVAHGKDFIKTWYQKCLPHWWVHLQKIVSASAVNSCFTKKWQYVLCLPPKHKIS